MNLFSIRASWPKDSGDEWNGEHALTHGRSYRTPWPQSQWETKIGAKTQSEGGIEPRIQIAAFSSPNGTALPWT